MKRKEYEEKIESFINIFLPRKIKKYILKNCLFKKMFCPLINK